jgi:poly(3-hydroxybutyrate) depolymerase
VSSTPGPIVGCDSIVGDWVRFLVYACVAAALLGGCADEGTSGPVADIGQIGDDVTSPVDDAGVTPDGASEDGEGDTYIPSEDVIESDTSPGPPPFYLGGKRPANYFMPFDYDGATPVPMLIALHGYGSNATSFEAYFQLGEVTKTSGVLLVVPQGTTNPGGSNFWNATDGCCNVYNSPVDDVAYLSELIEEAQLYFNVDPKRIYLVGHSNGGFMSYRMACDRSDLIAGIVNFAGATWSDPADCGNPDPVAILHVHGVFDAVIPYNGLISNEGNPNKETPPVGECLKGQCTDHFEACQDDAGCKSYYNCLGACSQQPNADSCYEACWAQASDATKILWMPVFTCGISLGCYSDLTQTWAGYPSAPKAVARWAERNGCSEDTEDLAPIDIIWDYDTSDTVPTRHLGCPEGVGTELWSIVYGSHSPTWNNNWNNAIVTWLLEQHKP